MKNYTQFLPLTAFAAATLLGGSLSANENATESSRARGRQFQQTQTQQSVRDQRSDWTQSRPTKASDLLGMNIDTHADEKIGEIDEIYFQSNSGKVLGLVVSTGGFLGIGQGQSLISMDDLRLNDDHSKMQTNLTKDQIENSPRYKKGETNVLHQVRPLGRSASISGNRSDRSDRSNWNEGRQDSSARMTGGDARSDRANRTEVAQHSSRGLAISDLMGMSVENRQGDSIGNVDEVFIDLNQKEIVGVVISTGGFLGIGDRKTLFGMNELTLDGQNEKMYLDYNREQVRAFPEFKSDEQSVWDDLRERLNPLDTSREARDRANAQRDALRDARVEVTTVGNTSDMTVFNQGNTKEEIDMTASIRRAIRSHNDLSSRANNVTIITNNGKVLLRGDVDSATEKSTVEGIAHDRVGRENVNSELNVRTR